MVFLSREILPQQFGNHYNEFLSLSRETDAELFYEGLYNLGVRLEQSGHAETAARVYGYLAAESAEHRTSNIGHRPSNVESPNSAFPFDRLRASSIPQSTITQQAQERLNALRGEGPIGLHLEVLGRSFARQAMAPAPLIGMGVAGLAFRGMNLFAATRLANLSAGILTRGPGLRILSGLAGFAAEVPAFTLTGRAVDRLLMGDVGAGLRPARGPALGGPLLEEMASAALVLGSLKLFGAAFGRAGQALPLPGTRYAVPAQGVLQQAAMLTGIMAGHGLEVAFGLRERQAPSLFLAESLATLAQFNVAGRLSNSVFGERYKRLQRQMAMQAEVVGSAGVPKYRNAEERARSRVQGIIEQMRERLGGPSLAGAVAGVGSEDIPQLLAPLRMSNTKDSGGGPRGEVIPFSELQRRRTREQLLPYQEYFLERGVDPQLVSRALSEQGNFQDQAQMIFEALLKDRGEGAYHLDYERAEEFRKILRHSPFLKEALRKSFEASPFSHQWEIMKRLAERLGLDEESTSSSMATIISFPGERQPSGQTSSAPRSSVSANDAHHGERQLQEFIQEWCGLHRLTTAQQEWERVARRLSLMPTLFKTILSFYARTNAFGTKVFFLQFNLLGQNSPLRNDMQIRNALRLKSREVMQPQEFEERFETIVTRMNEEFHRQDPRFFFRFNEFEVEYLRKKIEELPPALVELLVNRNLTAEAFYLLVTRLGLSPAGRLY